MQAWDPTHRRPIGATPETPRRSVSAEQAAEALDRHAADGLVLLKEATLVAMDDVDQDHLAYDAWTQRFERWCSLTRAALLSLYSDEAAARAFERAVGNVFRRPGQSDPTTFAYQKEATRNGIETLRALEERATPGLALDTGPDTVG